ncbi:MAG: pyruvate dehydrogenase complex dihydrolipoamide acetyltransferase [Bacteroidia bacterium]|nr:pyruvate dehydrogenase complex dihydrolipoamide acetyltransferase [Bacteroidia bacterium]
MAEVIRMPRMSDTMEEGVIVGWLKDVGDSVEPGDVLAEVETDKATMELESYQEGTLLYIGVKEGPVPVNGVLAVIGESGEDFQSALEEASNEEIESSEKSDDSKPQGDTTQSQSKVEQAIPEPVASAISDTDSRVKASPLAKSIALEAGIDLRQVSGSGDNGRIVKKDVESFIASGARPAQPEQKPKAPQVDQDLLKAMLTSVSAEESFVDTPLSQMRKTIARRLGESKFSAPHFYLTIDIDMNEVISARKSLNEFAPVKISFNDMIVKAAAMALRIHPGINSAWMEDRIRTNHHVHVGVAVAIDEGLVVPVIRHTDHKSLSQINVEVRDLATKAKNKKIMPDEMQGNTFTISNLGMFGIEEFTAIINPPAACILAVGSIVQKPVVKDGEIKVGNRMRVTLSCDHRVVDGATGAKFLKTFTSLLESPVRLLA